MTYQACPSRLLSIAMECRQLTGGLLLHCRDQEQQAEGPATQQDLTKLADDLVQKFEDQWKAAAENLEAASKAFDNLEGTACAMLELPNTHRSVIAAASWLSLLCKDTLSFFAWRSECVMSALD